MFKDRIRNGYAQFSPGFRRLADFILNHTLEAALLTATELATTHPPNPGPAAVRASARPCSTMLASARSSPSIGPNSWPASGFEFRTLSA